MAVATVAFSKKDAKGLSSKTLRKLRSGMEQDGAVRLEGLFPLPLLRRIRAEVMRRHESGQLRRKGLIRDIGGRYAALLPFEGPFLEPAFYGNPKLRGLMGALLGADHCIGSLEAVISLPGASPQHQHIDGPLRFDRLVGRRKEPFRGDLSKLPPYAVGLAVPLCDIDEENGPTAIWPGSHKTALRPKPPSEARVLRDYPCDLMGGPFGSAYLFDYRVFHGGTENFSREPRPLLMLVLTRSWFRDPNLAEVQPSLVITKRSLGRVPARFRYLFQLAPAAKRALW